jgi:hypothetical protein
VAKTLSRGDRERIRAAESKRPLYGVLVAQHRYFTGGSL